MSGGPEDVVWEAPGAFELLDGVSLVDATTLRAWREDRNMAFWLALEAAAQAAALHQRQLADFGLHAFLLSFGDCVWPEGTFSGRLEIDARLLGRTSGAAAYEVALRMPGLETRVPAHIGLTPYDAVFRKELLRESYRERFRRLCARR